MTPIEGSKLSKDDWMKNLIKCWAFKKKLKSIKGEKNIVKSIPYLVVKTEFSTDNKNTTRSRSYRDTDNENLSDSEEKINKDIIISLNNQIKALDFEISKHKKYSDSLKVRLSTLTDKEICSSIDEHEKLVLWTDDIKKTLNEINRYKEKLATLYQDIIKNTDSEIDPCNQLDKQTTPIHNSIVRCPENFWANLICIWKYR